jgi:3-oxoacyl-[acyl-carrier-protein] synthase II
MNRVAVIGIGMIDTLGNNYKDCTEAFFSENYKDPVPFDWCELEQYRDQVVFPVTSDPILPEIEAKTLKRFDDNLKYGLHAVHQALQDSEVEISPNVAVVASNTSAGDKIVYKTMDDLHKYGKMKRPLHFLAGFKDFFSGFVCNQWGFTGASIAMNSACATSLSSLDYAMRLVDEYDYVVCAVSDDSCNEILIPFFSNINALGTHSNPFGEDRDGFIPSSGGACFILQAEDKVKKKPHAWLHPVGLASDTSSATAPSPDGAGAKIVMDKALQHCNKHEIAFVNTHGTSTPVGDEIEQKAIGEVFNSESIELFAPKKQLGHAMGTCGILEAIYGIEKVKRDGGKTKFLNNSFGFGGKCASQVVEVVV